MSLYALVVLAGYSQMHAPRFPQLPSAHVGEVRAPTSAQLWEPGPQESFGEPLYQFEYRVDYEDERQPPSFTVCVVAADVRANQLYTFASRVPAKVWESGKADDLREAARSFVLL